MHFYWTVTWVFSHVTCNGVSSGPLCHDLSVKGSNWEMWFQSDCSYIVGFIFSSSGQRNHVRYCDQFASVVDSVLSFHISIFLTRNHWTKWNQPWQKVYSDCGFCSIQKFNIITWAKYVIWLAEILLRNHV